MKKMKTVIIPTTTTEHLAKKIKEKTKNFVIVFPEKNREGKRYFPDGEIYIKIPKIGALKNKKVVILHSGSSRPNQGLIELELILQILNENKIKPIIFFTYFPYSRQDKIFEKGETNAAESLIRKLIKYYKVKKIYIIDPHFEGRNWVKKYPIVSVSAVPLLMKKSEQDFGKNILFLSPDKGGERRTGITGVRKKRKNSSKIEICSFSKNLKGKIIGVVDDIIGGGGTLLQLYKIVKKSKPKKIIALITHGVLKKGVKKIKKKFLKLYLTNAIAQKETNVDISDLIINSLIDK